MEKFLNKYRLAIVVSHPIQYYSPLYKELAKEINLKVFYCFNPSSEQQGKDGFGLSFVWDVDLFEGYDYEFLENVSVNPSSSSRNGCDTPGMDTVLDFFNPTHIVTFGWHLKSYQQAHRYSKNKSIPIAVRGDSKIDKTGSFLKKILKRVYYPLFLSRYDAFLSVGIENKNYLQKYKVPLSKIIFSPHAVDQQFWSGYKKPNLEFTFIWVAKFIPLKRPLDVIDAFTKVHETIPNISLKMIGAGPILEKSIERAKGCSKISFLGFKNQGELREEYLSSDVLILSSDSETWGLVVNEAYSIGLKAIVSSEVGCAKDLIQKGTGLTYKVGDVNGLAGAMLIMYNEREKIEYKEKLKQINSIYSLNSNVNSFKKFLSEVSLIVL